MADKVSFKALKTRLPNLSRYRFNIAWHHILLHGRSATVPLVENKRMKVSPPQLDHFLAFITSSYVMQDLPFGEKTLKLSSNSEIRVANVVRTMIPEQIVQQYQSYWHETGSVPISRSTLYRILKVCSAFIRKSLQGLDYVSAEGAKAFDELAAVVENLGDYSRGACIAKFEIIVRPTPLNIWLYPDYGGPCDHAHDLAFDRCKLFPNVVHEVESALENDELSSDEKDEMNYVVSLAKKRIKAWKADLLRSINQD
ncbi:hypothetical protein AWC38_SpisGene18536 [Stylophora pistillata]|uniref:Uncharacterized protein n=1 Tax=Stylophora pistillata TaxID=50429 RepID=A0A2B4RLM9_STYPI|nr:hypothetical protein AWC38_SpisGene18536 [Stylophora pistillata]